MEIVRSSLGGYNDEVNSATEKRTANWLERLEHCSKTVLTATVLHIHALTKADLEANNKVCQKCAMEKS